MTRLAESATGAAALLDQQMTRLRERDPQPWGVWPWLGPILTTGVLIAIARVVVALAPATGSARTTVAVVASVAGELLLLLAAVAFGRDIAQRAGGWRAAFGVDRLRRSDWRPWLLGLGLIFAGRLAIAIVALAGTHGSAARQSQNVHLTGASPVNVTGLLILTVAVAPVVEEFVFRGLVLRTFMRSMAFWPATCVSSVIFALFHAAAVRTIPGAITLAASVAVLGLANCLLVRITGRLGPGVLVHATFNLIGALVVIHQAAC